MTTIADIATANTLASLNGDEQFYVRDDPAGTEADAVVTADVISTFVNASGYQVGGTDVAVADGGTGASTAAAARTNLGLGSLATQNTITITHDIIVTFPSTVKEGDNASAWVCPRVGTLVETEIWCDIAPTVASVILDTHLNGTTVYTTQGNRPTIAISGTQDDGGTPELTALAAGDTLQAQVDQLNASDQGAIGQLFWRISWSETVS